MQHRRIGGMPKAGPISSRLHMHMHLDPAARLRSMFESGFPYSKRLEAHKSCVNAIAFSHGDGRWLASAGDDLRILLWDFHQENVDAPSCSLTGHRSNIFCLDFSARNQYIYSGSTDEKILKYDVATASTSATGQPVQTFATHEGNIRGISCHPENDDIVLSASEDGLIALHDSRLPSGLAGTLVSNCEMTDVQFHPCAEKLFFTASAHGDVCLRDARMAFSSEDAGGGVRGGGKGSVVKYATAITRRSVPYMVQPEASSLAVDRDGTKFAVNFLHHLPTIYATADPIPLAVCSGRTLPDRSPIPEGERTYQNSCTIKHGAFGGPSGDVEDGYYTTGSDDFRAYVWKVPDVAVLKGERREMSKEVFLEEAPRTVAYAEGYRDEKRYIPVELSTPLFRLQGHESIINSSIIHPHLPQIVTCGVERHLTVHSPTEGAPNMAFARTQVDVRALPGDEPQVLRRYFRAMLAGHVMNEEGETEEQNTIDFFDGVVRENEKVNVFTAGMRLGGDEEEEDS